MSHSQNDELASLFAQRMTFSPSNGLPVQQSHGGQQQQEEVAMQSVKDDPVPESYASQNKDAPVTFISAHYTHTTHIRPSVETISPPPLYSESLMSDAMVQVLRQHSIDPSSLLPNQIQLFANAEYEQRLRLLELWRIAPPSYVPLEEHVHAAWAPTTVELEESMAKVRFENAMMAREMQTEARVPSRHDIHFDTHVEPMSPIRGPGEPAWPPAARMRAASIASATNQAKQNSDAEPYILSGYRAGADQRQQHQQQHLDPVYAANQGLWQAPTCNHPQLDARQTMEDQYGSLMQIRNHADWEAMNERIARERMSNMTSFGDDGRLDDDMEL